MSENIFCGLGNLPKHDHSTTIVVIKINPFGYLPSCNGQQNSASAIVACLAWGWVMCLEEADETYPTIVFESDARLVCIRRFNKDKFVLPHFSQDALSRNGWLCWE